MLDADRTACGVALPPSHAHALLLLADAEETLSPGALARALGLDKSSATRLCQRLEAAGHLARARDGQNGRSLRLELTAKGRRAADRIGRSSGERHDALWNAIPASRRAAVVNALETLTRAMASIAQEGTR
jgi:DNA-binding MarR family transcriptional regulator